MKSLLIRLMPAALLCLALTACGGGGAVGQTPYDPETAAQALLDSGAFSDALDTVDQDTAAALDEAGVWYCGGKNSPYIWLRCPNNMGSWEFFDWLLETANVVGTPGEGFGPCGKGYFRLTAFGDAARTKEAAARIKAALAAL